VCLSNLTITCNQTVKSDTRSSLCFLLLVMWGVMCSISQVDCEHSMWVRLTSSRLRPKKCAYCGEELYVRRYASNSVLIISFGTPILFLIGIISNWVVAFASTFLVLCLYAK
jgi:hypothetical protein